MCIVTSQLNGETLDKYITYEDGNYIPYQEIMGNIGIKVENSEQLTHLQEIAFSYINNYIRRNKIELPKPLELQGKPRT